MIKLNKSGVAHANNLIAQGKVNKNSSWSFSASDENKMLGENGDDWKEFGSYHLAIHDDQNGETKAYYGYPFGKNGKVYRKALTAIRQRAGQQDETEIFEAAGRLLETIDKNQDSRPNNGIERRYIPVTEIRVMRSNDESESPKLIGYAAVFNSLSDDLGGFREKIKRGAFKETIKTSDVRALWNHNPDFVLGRTKSGTLELKEDAKGLKIEIDPPDNHWAKDFMVSVERGDVNQMSFGFKTISDAWEIKNKENIRTLEEVELFDVSPVTFPAYPDTEIQARSHFEKAGLNYESINHIFIKVEHNLKIEEEDRSIIDDAVRFLQNLIPLNADAGGGLDNDEGPMHQIEILKKRIELRDRSIKLEV